MAITRLKRKHRKNIARANNKQRVIKQLLATPVIKNVDIEELKAQFGNNPVASSSTAPSASVTEKVSAAATTATETVTSAASTTAHTISETFSNVVKAVTDKVEDVVEAVKDKVEQVTGSGEEKAAE